MDQADASSSREPFEFDAFLCYSAEDASIADQICDVLAEEGRRVRRLCDDNAPTGVELAQTAQELRGSRRVLGLVSEAWLAGWWNQGGATLLADQENRAIRLIPLVFEGIGLDRVPDTFRDRPGIKVSTGHDGQLLREQTRAVSAVVCADHGTDQSTVLRLHRWFDGDDQALEQLLSDNLEWMQTYVRKHLNARLRRRFDSMDVVQEGAMRILRYNPRHPPANKAQMRALFKKALLDALRDKIDHLTANRRNIDREESIVVPFASGEASARMSSEEQPDELAEKQEQREWVKLALQFLDSVDRAVILRRDYHKEAFEAIADGLGLASPDAARMRYNRALPKLATKIRELRRHQQSRKDSSSPEETPAEA